MFVGGGASSPGCWQSWRAFLLAGAGLAGFLDRTKERVKDPFLDDPFSRLGAVNLVASLAS